MKLALLWVSIVTISLESRADPVIWPAAGAPLHPPSLGPGTRRKPWRIFLDAGHGSPGNTGNKSVICEDEAIHTLRVAEVAAATLRETGRFVVKVSREGSGAPTYRERLAAAVSFNADAIVSIHSDARGAYGPWELRPGVTCLRNDEEPGLGVLLSDEGPQRLVDRRRQLAKGVSEALGATGFPLYDGRDWLALYAPDANPGVFIDRRPKRLRVFLLRKPRIPSIIIETHHALDFEENARWGEPATWSAFASGLAAGLDAGLQAKARSADPR